MFAASRALSAEITAEFAALAEFPASFAWVAALLALVDAAEADPLAASLEDSAAIRAAVALVLAVSAPDWASNAAF